MPAFGSGEPAQRDADPVSDRFAVRVHVHVCSHESDRMRNRRRMGHRFDAQEVGRGRGVQPLRRAPGVKALALAAVFLGIGLFTPACQPRHPFVWANDRPLENVTVVETALLPGDEIQIQVQNWEDLRAGQTYRVLADGTIVLPLIGRFEVEGLTVEQVAQKLDMRLKGMIVTPQSRVSVATPRTPRVTVVGEVAQPNLYAIAPGDGLLTALAMAGGLTEFASPDEIYVIRKVPKDERIRFRYADLVGGVKSSAGFKLQDGDIIVVE